ncbi:RING-H2 finger protein ATL8-like [Musa acuminata AAA Group]|uniref:RING-H2 finger protein ATL8-like n=1 Tax=Musa acuminata AAA Group TaxID=214697 RepID=UPI0031D5F632
MDGVDMRPVKASTKAAAAAFCFNALLTTEDDGVCLTYPAVLASFPVVTCPEARGAGEGMVGRECAVCLTEFGVGDALRVLPPCRHGFHPVCIDPWLAGHATCPLCRSDLAAGHVIVNGVEA